MWTSGSKVFQNPLRIDGAVVFNPNAEQLTAAGYVQTFPVPVSSGGILEVRRYSKLKIIRALGDGWAVKKAELEAAGMYDEFVNAAFLQSDDPVFASIHADLSAEERVLLEACRYED